jgi:hypothetical protein
MPLRIVTDEATPPDDPPRLCPRGLRRLSPAAASRRSGQYRRGYSLFACSLRQTKIIRNATPSGFGRGSSVIIEGCLIETENVISDSVAGLDDILQALVSVT